MGTWDLIYRDLNMLDRRVTYKRRASYRTKSNRFKKVKTPGGKLAIQYIKKKTNGTKMQGVKAARPYGGVLTHQQVRERITRAFMIEELNSIKVKAANAEGSKKKGKKGGKKPTKK